MAASGSIIGFNAKGECGRIARITAVVESSGVDGLVVCAYLINGSVCPGTSVFFVDPAKDEITCVIPPEDQSRPEMDLVTQVLGTLLAQEPSA
jgi:hypothetical protein